MSALINSLKSEIARVARKELKEEIQGLRKVTTAHRAEIAALKRQVKVLATALRAANKNAKPSKTAAEATDESNAPGFRFSPERLTAVREKLGLSKTELALLADTSYLSMHKWETDKAKPRAAQLQKLAVISKLGKREAQRRLLELQSK